MVKIMANRGFVRIARHSGHLGDLNVTVADFRFIFFKEDFLGLFRGVTAGFCPAVHSSGCVSDIDRLEHGAFPKGLS